MTENNVTFKRAELTQALPDWELILDACAGERAVKDRGETYLPKPNPDDKSAANAKRYKQYLSRAVYYNATGRTLRGLVGAAFRKIPSLTLPPALSYMAADVDGSGVSIYQQSQSALTAALQIGRHALFVDYPAIDGQLSLAQQRAANLKASIISIPAQRVINWRVESVGGMQRLTLVTIEENIETVTADGFGSDAVKQYRVLRLIDGIYTVQIWRNIDDNYVLTDERRPLDGYGNAWELIPLTFIGSENNDSNVDPAPMLDLARLNIAHYRNSADYEDSVFFVGQAQAWISGLTEDWRDHIEKSGMYVGSRAPILLPQNGAFGFAQAQPNTLVKEAMDAKEQQMISIGARLIQPGQPARTATEVDADTDVQHSILSMCVSNVSDAYTLALQWAARYMGVAIDGIQYAINQEYTRQTFDPQALVALVQAWQAGIIPRSDLNGQLRSMGIIDAEKTDDTIRGELESDTTGLGLDDV